MKIVTLIILALISVSQASQPRYRLYNDNDGNHHYTANELEYNSLISSGWNDEGFDHQVPSSDEEGAIEYYRLYNPYSSEHLWTTSFYEYTSLGDIGWIQEGSDVSVFAEGNRYRIPLFRVYNPNSGLHHFTTSLGEQNILVDLGWIDEGISCYVYPAELVPSSYTVTFVLGENGTTEDEDDLVQEVDYSNPANAPNVVANPGYTFLGWDTDFSSVESELTINAVYEHTGLLITFIAGDGGSVSKESILVLDQEFIEVEAIPEEGYQFKHWTSTAGSFSVANPLIESVLGLAEDVTVYATFEPIPYTIAFNTDGNGTVSSASQIVGHSGDSEPVTATANEGYVFAGWTGDITSTDNPLIVQNVAQNMNVIANFERITFTITFETDGNGTVSSTNQVVDYNGDAQPVTAIPNEGYRFVRWSGPGVNNTDNPIAFLNVLNDMTVTANFEIITYTITFSSSGNGAVSSETQVVDYNGSTTPVTATPDDGYRFVNWTVQGVPIAGNPLTVSNVNTDIAFIANFEPIPYTITIRSSLGGNPVTRTVSHGERFTFTLGTSPGNVFTGWTGDITSSENPLIIDSVTQDMDITANFEPITYSVLFRSSSSGKGLITMGSGPVNSIGSTINHGGDFPAPITAVPNEGFEFTGWTGDITSSDNPFTLQNITQDMVITANFELISYTLTFNAGYGGTVSKSQEVVSRFGDAGTVTASADPGYEFTGWTGDIAQSSPILNVTNVTSDMTITANFRPIYEPPMMTYLIHVNVNDGAGGTVSTTTEFVDEGFDSGYIYAYPNPGYEFTGWSGGVNSSSNPLVVRSVYGDLFITANFRLIE